MKNGDAKLLVGLLLGAAVGGAIGYLAGSEKGEQLLEDLKEVAGKMKDGFNTALDKAKESGNEALKAVKKPAE